ncbi:hypothetical protein BGX24_006254 [Mortierella sp. AD032]|nr:hypothetical protein BGX24_006254 [Mortierella sp. AD032]
MIYNFTSSKYMTHYTPPAFYKDLKPPPRLTRTTAPWATDSPTTSSSNEVDRAPVSIGAAVGGTAAGLAVLGPVDMFQSDSYADDVPQKKESEMAQEVIESIYELDPELNDAIPDLVDEPSSEVGMDWAKQLQKSNPHSILNVNKINEAVAAE